MWSAIGVVKAHYAQPFVLVRIVWSLLLLAIGDLILFRFALLVTFFLWVSHLGEQWFDQNSDRAKSMYKRMVNMIGRVNNHKKHRLERPNKMFVFG